MGLPLSTAVPDGGYCAGVKKLTLGAGALITGMVRLLVDKRQEEGDMVEVDGEQCHLFYMQDGGRDCATGDAGCVMTMSASEEGERDLFLFNNLASEARILYEENKGEP